MRRGACPLSILPTVLAVQLMTFCHRVVPILGLPDTQHRAAQEGSVDAPGALLGPYEKYISPSISSREMDLCRLLLPPQVLSEAESGKLRLLYLAPEKLSAFPVQSCLRRLNLALVVVDEAHCMAEWGEGFRPSYFRSAPRYHSSASAYLWLTYTTATQCNARHQHCTDVDVIMCANVHRMLPAHMRPTHSTLVLHTVLMSAV